MTNWKKIQVCRTWNFSKVWSRPWFLKTLIFRNQGADEKANCDPIADLPIGTLMFDFICNCRARSFIVGKLTSCKFHKSSLHWQYLTINAMVLVVLLYAVINTNSRAVKHHKTIHYFILETLSFYSLLSPFENIVKTAFICINWRLLSQICPQGLLA